MLFHLALKIKSCNPARAAFNLASKKIAVAFETISQPKVTIFCFKPSTNGIYVFNFGCVPSRSSDVIQAAIGQCQRNESQLCIDSTSAPKCNARLPSNPLLHTPAVSHSSWHDAGQYSMECLYSDVRLFFLSVKCSLICSCL